ncbi:MAG: hypothetical protein ACRDQA_06995, partial [Nocardioidaceae bacterium]
WARCDWSELPDAIAQGYGIQVWSGEAGHRVPSTLVKSFPDACDYDGMTELYLGKKAYLGNAPAGLGEFLVGPPKRDVPLPADAVDTGYHLRDQHLWLSADRRRAYVGTRAEGDVWPRVAKRLVCG